MIFHCNEKQTPTGSISVSGAKNSATRLLAAATLSGGTSTLSNFPVSLVDVQHKIDFLRECGVSIVEENQSTVSIDASGYNTRRASFYDVPIRTTYLLAAGALARNGIAHVPYPGGCRIGTRPYDVHVLIWKTFGCDVEEKENYIEVTNNKLVGGTLDLPISTVGGTENALLCASVAAGPTTIRNAYLTPEIHDLIGFLRAMGVVIEFSGGSFLRVIPPDTLRSTTYRVMPDRIEALTWIVYGALAKGSINIANVPFDSMTVPFTHLRSAGLDLYTNSNSVYLDPSCYREGIEPFEVACGTHPGVISDMQPLFVMLALAAKGRSRVFDYRYPDRTAYLVELQKFVGDAISWERGQVKIVGPGEFKPAAVDSTDLRGSAVLAIAAMMAGGGSTVDKFEMALRGYDRFVDKVSSLGVSVNVKPE